MRGNMRKEYQLNNLGCADCAAKMEKQIESLDFISVVHLDFVMQRLKIEVKPPMDSRMVKDSIYKIITDIEDDVRIVELDESADFLSKSEKNDHDYDHELDEKRSIRVILFSSVLLVLPWILEMPTFMASGLYFIAYLAAGASVLKKAMNNLLKGKIFDENFLMSIATLGAFAIGEYPEGVAVMLFYQVGEYFQGKAINRSRTSIASLMNIKPEYASLVTEKGVERVKPSTVEPGQQIMVKPGEKIPLDGHVLSGNSMVDTSALTGESMPRDVMPDSEVLSGSINQTGLLTVQVDKKYGDSTVSKILELVENASAKKAKTEKFITRFARYYTPVVVGIAVIIALVPPLVIQGALFSDWIYRALIFLVISCPCALVISIPLGFFGGIGGASRKGILVKGGNYLEALNEVKTVIFDKTGTLTEGAFQVDEIYAVNGFEETEILEKMAAAEFYSNHPIAESIRKAYGKKIDQTTIEDHQEIPGGGIISNISGQKIVLGKMAFLQQQNITTVDYSKPGTVIHIAVDQQYAGYVVIRDQVKSDAAEAIRGLKEAGIKRLIMLTGDQKAIADQIANSLGIEEVYADLLPDGKIEITEKIMRESAGKGKVMVVGDGVNDAPVLARADIGVSMGGLGSDAAIEASDIVIMTDTPSSIIAALQIARKTHRVVWQNIIAALGIKAIVMLLGAMGMATIWEAVFADVGVALLAILNAMRVIRS